MIVSSAPCESRQGCPEIEKAKLEIYHEVNRILREGLDPIINELRESGKAMAIQAERLKFGAERFENIEVCVRDLQKRTDHLESWEDAYRASQKTAEAAGRRAGQFWGGIAIIIDIVSTIFGMWSHRGGQ